ncbi:unnamed protein product [Prorocentrum cordatum]|uniref:Peptidase M23 domain-containing protein n=1 Tax=Prorocentrum cordatum TaxID=2364126 RepID=A0ABN9UCX7_9DINO|nr:unnamed protein product [Polarella glacialis]
MHCRPCETWVDARRCPSSVAAVAVQRVKVPISAREPMDGDGVGGTAQDAISCWLHDFQLSAGEPILQKAGVEYGSEVMWWSDSRRRKRPHEGIDITLADACSMRSLPLRFAEPGRVVGIIDDFLGRTVIVQRPRHREQFWLYAHVELADDIELGCWVTEASFLGHAAASATKCPSHLHISLVESAGVMSPTEASDAWQRVTWSTIHEWDWLRFVPLTLQLPQRRPTHTERGLWWAGLLGGVLLITCAAVSRYRRP